VQWLLDTKQPVSFNAGRKPGVLQRALGASIFCFVLDLHQLALRQEGNIPEKYRQGSDT
jgi:hypothetical protein